MRWPRSHKKKRHLRMSEIRLVENVSTLGLKNMNKRHLYKKIDELAEKLNETPNSKTNP